MSIVDLGAFGILAAACVVAFVCSTPTATVTAVIVGLVAALAIFHNRPFSFTSASSQLTVNHRATPPVEEMNAQIDVQPGRSDAVDEAAIRPQLPDGRHSKSRRRE